jgi:hypothetical protein
VQENEYKIAIDQRNMICTKMAHLEMMLEPFVVQCGNSTALLTGNVTMRDHHAASMQQVYARLLRGHKLCANKKKLGIPQIARITAANNYSFGD